MWQMSASARHRHVTRPAVVLIFLCVSSDGTEVLTQLYCGAPCARPALQQKAARRGGLGIAALFMLLQLLAGEFDDAVILQTFGDVPDDLLAVG